MRLNMRNKNKKAEELFNSLYDTHADAIFRFCFFKTGDREIAKDLTQDVFIKVFNYLVKGEEILNEKTFIYAIAKNVVIDFWRKKKAVNERDLPEDFMSSVPSQSNTEVFAEYQIFLSLLDKLSPSDREVIILRFIEDMSSKDMAELLRERENTILVRISRATTKLKELVEGNNMKI
jgi:RNA polymerase sigma-70 factor (ECF subfamily)